MDSKERQYIEENTARLDEWENSPLEPVSLYDDMSMRELKLLVQKQAEMIDEFRRMISHLEEKIDRQSERIGQLTDALTQANRDNSELRSELMRMLRDREADRKLVESLRTMISELETQLADARNQASVDRSARFASKSQRGKGRRDGEGENGNTRGKDSAADRGGDPGETRPSAQEEKESMGGAGSVELLDGSDITSPDGTPELPRPKTPRPYRRGMKHDKPHADTKIPMPSDKGLLPKGYQYLRTETKSVFMKRTVIEELEYEMVIALDPDGREVELYLPAGVESPQTVECFPHTMASPEMITSTVIDHYVLNVPYYRLWQHHLDCGLHTSRQTYINWMFQLYTHARNLIPHLLDTAVTKDSIVNCDETWCKVKIRGKYRRRYTWCLVNKELGIVVYFFRTGARSREAFKEFLDGRNPMAVQTDGYNVYMYLDDELTDVTHLCCMAHVRAKFRKAYETTGELDALFFLDRIGFLYGREDHYKTMGYQPDQIKEGRNSAETLAMLAEMRAKLSVMLQDGHPPRSELLDKAVCYMDSFWEPLVEYIKDGRYDIDNNEAERNMKPLANERKNSYGYGSPKMAEASAVIHSLIATCKKINRSVKLYFEKFCREIIHGNTDWPNLLPMTIGIPVNNG